MKKLTITAMVAAAVFTASAANLSATMAEVVSIKGEATYHTPEETAWKPASIGLKLTNGAAIKSGPASAVVLNFSNGHQTNLGANSSMEIKSLGDDTTLELFKGRLKSRVQELSSNQTYSVKTGEGVASVRGTIYEVIRVGGQTDVKVEEGRVNVKELVTGQSIDVDAGKFTKVKKNSPPTPQDDLQNYQEPVDEGSADGDIGNSEKTADKSNDENNENDQGDVNQTEDKVADGSTEDMMGSDKLGEDSQGNQETSDDLTSEGLSGDMLKAELRNEMKEAVNEIKVDVGSAQDLVEQQKDSDASTGRTLRDVHGNLVRVEQYMLRPENNTIEFVNITKRDNYKYKGRMGVTPTGARLDTVELKATFNKKMPEKLSGWGSFLKDIADDEDSDFHPENIKVQVSNSIGGDKDRMVTESSWDASEEELKDPVMTFVSAKDGTWQVDDDYDDDNGVMWDGIDEDAEKGKIEMWAISPEIRLYQDSNSNGVFDSATESHKIVRLGLENWVINNDGDVLKVDDIFGVKDSANPFEILKNIAFENSLVARTTGEISLIDDRDDDDYTSAEYSTILSKFNSGTDFFKHNMDNILTPDFAIPILEEVAADAASDL